MIYSRTVIKLIFSLSLSFIWLTNLATAAPLQTRETQAGTDNFIYTVQPGDTLTLIALQFNLTLADIILANNLSNPNLIFPGQQLILPGMPRPRVSPTATETPLPNPDQTHIVQPGETLFGIANLYGVPIGTIVLANDLPNPDVIYAGQALQIPSGPPPTPPPLPTQP